jgi:hypothetical protein
MVEDERSQTPVYNTDARCFIGFVAHKSASERTCESVKKYRKKIEAALRFLWLHVEEPRVYK